MKMNFFEERLIVVLKKVLENSKLNFVYFFFISGDVVKVIYKVVMEY